MHRKLIKLNFKYSKLNSTEKSLPETSAGVMYGCMCRSGFADNGNWENIQRLLLNAYSQKSPFGSRLEWGNCDVAERNKSAPRPAGMCWGSEVKLRHRHGLNIPALCWCKSLCTPCISSQYPWRVAPSERTCEDRFFSSGMCGG